MKKFAMVVAVCAVVLATVMPAFAVVEVRFPADWVTMIGNKDQRGNEFGYNPNDRTFYFGGRGAVMLQMWFPRGTLLNYDGGDGQQPIRGKAKADRGTSLTWNGGWGTLSPEGHNVLMAAIAKASAPATPAGEVKIRIRETTHEERAGNLARFDQMLLQYGLAEVIGQETAVTPTSGWVLIIPDGRRDVVPFDTEFKDVNGITHMIFHSGQYAGEEFALPAGTVVDQIGAQQVQAGSVPVYNPGGAQTSSGGVVITHTPAPGAPTTAPAPVVVAPATPVAVSAPVATPAPALVTAPAAQLKPKTLADFRQLGQVEAISGTNGLGWKFFPNNLVTFIVADVLVKVDCDYQDADGKWHAARPGTEARVEFSGTLWFKKAQK
jgi:hypothetical protein